MFFSLIYAKNNLYKSALTWHVSFGMRVLVWGWVCDYCLEINCYCQTIPLLSQKLWLSMQIRFGQVAFCTYLDAQEIPQVKLAPLAKLCVFGVSGKIISLQTEIRGIQYLEWKKLIFIASSSIMSLQKLVVVFVQIARAGKIMQYACSLWKTMAHFHRFSFLQYKVFQLSEKHRFYLECAIKPN